MKKPVLPLLILLTCIFTSFTLGFFLGRNANHTPVQLSTPVVTESATTPPTSEPESTEKVPETEPEETGPVNINTATAEQLQTLPGIGPVLAQRIIDYRTEHGDYPSVDALLGVSGIGEKKLEALLGLVTTQ